MTRPGFNILYHPLAVKKDIPKLSKTERHTIKKTIENKLMSYPHLYGQPLRGTLKQYWKLRVGDWRVVYSISKKDVNILLIIHRSSAYKEAQKRI